MEVVLHLPPAVHCPCCERVCSGFHSVTYTSAVVLSLTVGFAFFQMYMWRCQGVYIVIYDLNVDYIFMNLAREVGGFDTFENFVH